MGSERSRTIDTYLGIDWGGTYIKSGLIDARGRILKQETFSSRQLKKKDVFIDKVISLIKAYRTCTIKAIGIGAPGIVDTKKGFIYYLPNIPGWINYPLKNVLEKKSNLPVFVDNDANVFALAEARLGTAKGARRAIFLTLGTGLGGAVIWNGKILEGNVSASEIGHVPLALAGTRCSCGGRGCIETFVGAQHLVSRYQTLKKNTSSYEVKDIFRNALNGEKEALTVWQEFSQALGTFLGGLVNIFNPEVIVLGGGVAGAFRLFKPLVLAALKKQAMWPNLKGLSLVRAKLKNPGIIGAGLLAKEALN
ncbi:MAG: ROK family protein [Candidatus Omnitrophica bacterium]|nr:ROK family protein [Candidatus Omnitrophota bacterium]